MGVLASCTMQPNGVRIRSACVNNRACPVARSFLYVPVMTVPRSSSVTPVGDFTSPSRWHCTGPGKVESIAVSSTHDISPGISTKFWSPISPALSPAMGLAGLAVTSASNDGTGCWKNDGGGDRRGIDAGSGFGCTAGGIFGASYGTSAAIRVCAGPFCCPWGDG